MWGHIFNFYTDLCYVHVISIYFWAFLQNIVPLSMDLYAREILLQRKFLILPPRRDIPPSIPSKKRGVESRRSKHPFEPDLKKVLDLVGNLLPIFDSYKICWIPTSLPIPIGFIFHGICATDFLFMYSEFRIDLNFLRICHAAFVGGEFHRL